MSLHTRKIRQRWLIEGMLELLTPTHLSNGDDAPGVDLPLVMDMVEKRPLLTGASLAGALRNFVNEYHSSYVQKKDDRSGKKLILEKDRSVSQLLFGASRRDDKGDQSPLIVCDALGKTRDGQTIELRDGVRIDPATRTAVDGAKFDLELLPAGTTFDIGFELIITEPMEKKLPQIQETLALALWGLQTKQIRLGGRKRRGYGECEAKAWRVWKYDLTKRDELNAWLLHGRHGIAPSTTPTTGTDIRQLINNVLDLPEDRRNQFMIKADFEIDGSVLIRSGFEKEFGADMAHLESWREGEMVPILSGTSLAGAMRAQALRIARTMAKEPKRAEHFVRDLFGYMPTEGEEEDGPKGTSRVVVAETAVTGARKLVQSRVAIDRFTGGALESALFDEQPIFGGHTTITFYINQPNWLPEKEADAHKQVSDAEKGLLLLVLKDLWTGFTTIGGEASVGRGRLRGICAEISEKDNDWTLDSNAETLVTKGDPAVLEQYVNAFKTEIGKGAK